PRLADVARQPPIGAQLALGEGGGLVEHLPPERSDHLEVQWEVPGPSLLQCTADPVTPCPRRLGLDRLGIEFFDQPYRTDPSRGEDHRHLADGRLVYREPRHQAGPELHSRLDGGRGGAAESSQLLFDRHDSPSKAARRRSKPRWTSLRTVATGRPVASAISS